MSSVASYPEPCQGQIIRSGVVTAVLDHNLAVAGDFPHNGIRHALALADLAEERLMLALDDLTAARLMLLPSSVQALHVLRVCAHACSCRKRKQLWACGQHVPHAHVISKLPVIVGVGLMGL